MPRTKRSTDPESSNSLVKAGSMFSTEKQSTQSWDQLEEMFQPRHLMKVKQCQLLAKSYQEPETQGLETKRILIQNKAVIFKFCEGYRDKSALLAKLVEMLKTQIYALDKGFTSEVEASNRVDLCAFINNPIHQGLMVALFLSIKKVYEARGIQDQQDPPERASIRLIQQVIHRLAHLVGEDSKDRPQIKYAARTLIYYVKEIGCLVDMMPKYYTSKQITAKTCFDNNNVQICSVQIKETFIVDDDENKTWYVPDAEDNDTLAIGEAVLRVRISKARMDEIKCQEDWERLLRSGDASYQTAGENSDWLWYDFDAQSAVDEFVQGVLTIINNACMELSSLSGKRCGV